MKSVLVHLAYILASVLFIYGLKLLSSVRSARRGNFLASVAMLIAIVVTVWEIGALDWAWLLAAMLLGSIIGAVGAYKVQMTSMPQMVALFNGLGGGASTLVAISYIYDPNNRILNAQGTMAAASGPDTAATLVLSIIIGGITLSGSVIAFLKLKELMPGSPILFPGQNFVNAALGVGMIVVAGWNAYFAVGGGYLTLLAVSLAVIALIMGVLLVIPIGGADMPVVISLLNSYSGLAACATGFVLNNSLLIIAGSLVGASGIILTQIMCRAMNRSLTNVLFGGFGAAPAAGGKRSEYQNVTSSGAEEAAMIMESAELVIIVPGYGLAVAQAQHLCKEIADLLEKRGSRVLYAIHPVAGRMPGHMNVLLAEAQVPYEQLVEMDDINPEFKNADVVLVVGANDVVNPAASNDPSSPISGMPVLNVWEARTVMVMKRSLGSGFAGIKNELFEYDNTLMLFGDAKAMLQQIKSELQELAK